MANTIAISTLIKHLTTRKLEIALKAVEGGGEYKDFLINTGKVREIRSLIQLLEEKAGVAQKPDPGNVRADDVADDLDEDDPDDEDEEDEAPPPRRVRPSKPRGWGS